MAPKQSSERKFLQPLADLLDTELVIEVARAMRDLFHNPHPLPDNISAAVGLMNDDGRFETFEQDGKWMVKRKDATSAPVVAEPEVPSIGEQLATGEVPVVYDATAPGAAADSANAASSPAPVTPEDRLRFELRRHQEHKEQALGLARRYYDLVRDRTALASQVADLDKEIKAHVKLMAEHDCAPVDLQEPIPFGEAAGDKPATAETAPSVDGGTEFNEGRSAAAEAGRSEETCPYSPELFPRKRLWWVDGFRTARSGVTLQPAVEMAKLTERELEQNLLPSSNLPKMDRPPQVLTCTAYGSIVCIVIDKIPPAKGDLVRWHLQPLCTKDEWQQLYEHDYGRPVDGFDQTDEAREQRQLGGPDCGRVVKSGKRTFVVAPRSQLIVLTTGEAAEEDAAGDPEPTGETAADDAVPHDGKALAAGDG